MADTKEIYTEAELAGMHRLNLRRVCKGRGMSSEDCSKMLFEDMVAWVLEQQGGGGKGKASKSTAKAAPKTNMKSKSEPEPEPEAEPEHKTTSKAGGRRTPPKLPPKGRIEKDTESENTETNNANISELLEEQFKSVEAKLDTVGEVMDQNLNTITSDMNNLRADVYKILELLKHLGIWMESDSILSPENAPDGLGFQEKEAEVDEACSGNEEGGSQE
jgi:hypothetical protein